MVEEAAVDLVWWKARLCMKPKLLTALEAANLKGVTSAAVYAAIASNRLPHQRVLGRLALREVDVLAWTPTPHVGRRKGARLSEEAKARISQSQKQRWAQRKAHSSD